MTRTGAVALAAAVLATAALASAASLGGLTTRAVGAGGAAIPSCDAGFTIAYSTSGGDVGSVDVGDIADPACEGGKLRVTLASAAGTPIASGGPVSVPADGDSVADTVTVVVSPNPVAEQVASVHVTVVGP